MPQVYLARNTVNFMCYVGATSRTFEIRKEEHQNFASAGLGGFFYEALRTFGPSSFFWSVLLEDEDREFVFWAEKQFIRKLKTIAPNGYNVTHGGQGQSFYKWSDQAKTNKSKERIDYFSIQENLDRLSNSIRSK